MNDKPIDQWQRDAQRHVAALELALSKFKGHTGAIAWENEVMIAPRIVAALCALLLCGAVSASSPVVRDANGRVLGYYTGVAYISTMSNSGYLIVSPTGYV